MRLAPRVSVHLLGAALLCSLCSLLGCGDGGAGGLCPEKVNACNVETVGVSASNVIGCLPCSQDFLTGSYFDNKNSLLDTDFHDFVVKTVSSADLCNKLHSNSDKFRLSNLNRDLIGEGSHRHLVSTLTFDMLTDAYKWMNDQICEAIITERLPVGVFADPFELQHLVERKVFLTAGVFGDTNLELPSALSNRSIVEIHLDIGHILSMKSYVAVVQLPLHARYPPLDASGYAQVIIGKPDIFLRCREKHLKEGTCSWAISSLDSRSNSVIWQIPCGDGALTGIVSGVTFLSALICSLLIVSSAIFFNRNNDKYDDIKKSQ